MKFKRVLSLGLAPVFAFSGILLSDITVSSDYELVASDICYQGGMVHLDTELEPFRQLYELEHEAELTKYRDICSDELVSGERDKRALALLGHEPDDSTSVVAMKFWLDDSAGAGAGRPSRFYTWVEMVRLCVRDGVNEVGREAFLRQLLELKPKLDSDEPSMCTFDSREGRAALEYFTAKDLPDDGKPCYVQYGFFAGAYIETLPSVADQIQPVLAESPEVVAERVASSPVAQKFTGCDYATLKRKVLEAVRPIFERDPRPALYVNVGLTETGATIVHAKYVGSRGLLLKFEEDSPYKTYSG